MSDEHNLVRDIGGEKGGENPDWIETDAVPDIEQGFSSLLKKHADFEDFLRDRD